jgi:hypothetical protein
LGVVSLHPAWKHHKFTKPQQSIASHSIHLCCCPLHRPCPHSLS